MLKERQDGDDLHQLEWWTSAAVSAQNFNRELAMRARAAAQSDERVEAVLSQLPSSSDCLHDDRLGTGIGNGVWRQRDVLPLMLEDFLDGNPGSGQWNQMYGWLSAQAQRPADTIANVMAAALARSRLAPLLDLLQADVDALHSAQRVVDALRTESTAPSGAGRISSSGSGAGGVPWR